MFIGLTTLLYFALDNVVASLSVLEQDKYETAFAFILFAMVNCDLAAIEQAERSTDMMLTFTVGKSIQSALFVTPLVVIVGWGMGMNDLILGFDISEIGLLYLIIALYTWYYP